MMQNIMDKDVEALGKIVFAFSALAKHARL
jgi:hypothetical protein